jgi:hypothetical protein
VTIGQRHDAVRLRFGRKFQEARPNVVSREDKVSDSYRPEKRSKYAEERHGSKNSLPKIKVHFTRYRHCQPLANIRLSLRKEVLKPVDDVWTLTNLSGRYDLARLIRQMAPERLASVV